MKSDISAFPVPGSHQESGMTLRDYFAAKAMQQFMALYIPLPRTESTAIDKMFAMAQASYEMADQMLKARES